MGIPEWIFTFTHKININYLFSEMPNGDYLDTAFSFFMQCEKNDGNTGPTSIP